MVVVEGCGKFREGLDSRGAVGCKLGSGRRRDAENTQRKKREHEKSKFCLSTSVRIRRGRVAKGKNAAPSTTITKGTRSASEVLDEKGETAWNQETGELKSRDGVPAPPRHRRSPWTGPGERTKLEGGTVRRGVVDSLRLER